MTKLAIVLGALVVGATPALAADDSCEMSPSPTGPLRPLMETHTIPPYPPMSVSTNEAGTTLLEVLIGPDGKVVSDEVISSSGSARLDEAAAAHVKNVWRWDAKLPKGCQQGVTRVSIRWDLRDAPADARSPELPIIVADKADFPPDAVKRLEQGWSAIGLYIGPDGAVGMTKIIRSSGFGDLDEKAIALVRAHRWTPVLMDGKPIATFTSVAVEWTQDGKRPPIPK